jgi:hypothetical protein
MRTTEVLDRHRLAGTVGRDDRHGHRHHDVQRTGGGRDQDADRSQHPPDAHAGGPHGVPHPEDSDRQQDGACAGAGQRDRIGHQRDAGRQCGHAAHDRRGRAPPGAQAPEDRGRDERHRRRDQPGGEVVGCASARVGRDEGDDRRVRRRHGDGGAERGDVAVVHVSSCGAAR